MSNNDKWLQATHASEYATGLAATIETLLEAANNDKSVDYDGNVVPDDSDDARSVGQYIWDWPLEIVNQRGRRYEVVLTVGGPDARVVCDLDSDGERLGSAELVVKWGSDSSVRYSESINDFADMFVMLES